MSGWEKYVEQARRAYWEAGLTEDSPTERMRAALAAVGPLIQEDTRDRMVTAAAASLDRDGGGERWVATTVPCSACKAAAGGEVDLFEVLDQMSEEEEDL